MSFFELCKHFWSIRVNRRRLVFGTCLIFVFLCVMWSCFFKEIFYQRWYGKPTTETDFTIYLNEPEQIPVDFTDTFRITGKNIEFEMKPLANYKFYGMVGDKHAFKPKTSPNSVTFYAQIVPFDLCLLFGPMANKEFIKKYDFRTYGRGGGPERAISWNDPIYFESVKMANGRKWYRYYTNNHSIPANKNVYRALEIAKRYDMIYLEGYLVEYSGWEKLKDGSKWNGIHMKSSLTREDTRNGACEQFYIQKVILNGYIYQ